jgi:mono/diheme cytochrome c family protein
MRRLLCSGLLLILLLGLTTTAALAQDPDQGKLIWEEQTLCKNCHGDAGEGKWGAPLAGKQTTAQEWITQVRTPRRSMPSFSEAQVSDETIENIHAYLTSLPEVTEFTPPDAGLPADAHPGQMLIVEKRCVACHTITGPIGGFVRRGEAPTVEYVLNQVRNPREFMPTFSPGQVSDEEVAQIVEFLNIEFTEQTAQQPSTEPQAGQDQSAQPQQEEPAALPSSGASTVSVLPWLVLGIGLGLLLIGISLHRLVVRRA